VKKLIEYYASPAMGNFTLPHDYKKSGQGPHLGAAGSNKTKSTNRQKPKKR
tara:strand:+ start:254 stop:406 length:153 start_codon:yes stop_codon:yes gene_type:complete